MDNSIKNGCCESMNNENTVVQLFGLKKYCRDYVLNSEPKSRKALKAEIDSYLTIYDRKVEEEKNRKKELEGVPDEEGWVTITRNKGASRTFHEPQTNKMKKLKKKKELLDFYSHQKKELKNKEIQDIQERLKIAKEKINLMRQMRKFKPY